jgi:hypothetical protein
MRETGLLRDGHEPRVDREAEGPQLELPVRRPADRAGGRGDAGEEALFEVREGPVGLREDPRGRALVEVEGADLPRELRHGLNGARARADDGDVAPGERDVVTPSRRVKGSPGEGVGPGNIRDERAREAAKPEHEVPCADGWPMVEADLPGAGRGVEGGPGDLGVETAVGPEAVGADAILEIGEDLGLGREGAGPVCLRMVGERIEMGGHVAGAARVGVHPPGAARALVAVDEDEVPVTGANEAHRHAEAGKARAHDGDVDDAGLRVRGRGACLCRSKGRGGHGSALPRGRGGRRL